MFQGVLSELRAALLIAAAAFVCALPSPAHAQESGAEQQLPPLDPSQPPPPSPVPAVSPHFTRAQAEALLAASQATGLFEIVALEEDQVGLRHSASGVVCRFAPDFQNRINVLRPGRANSDVACISGPWPADAKPPLRRGSPQPPKEAAKDPAKKAPPRPGAAAATLSQADIADAIEPTGDEEPELVEVDEAGKSMPPLAPSAKAASAAASAPAPAAVPAPPAARAAASEPEPSEPAASEREPNEEAPPASTRAARAAAATTPPPSSQRRPTPLSANPFLDSAAPVSHRSPSSGRGLQTTVTGLASSPQATDVDFEADNPRKRKAKTWVVGVAIVAATVGITAAVFNSRGRLSELTGNGTPAGATSTAQAQGAPSTSSRSGLGAPPPLLGASGSASASGGAYDPTVTKKPIKPSATVAPRPMKRPDGDDDPVLVVPLPDREVPLPR